MTSRKLFHALLATAAAVAIGQGTAQAMPITGTVVINYDPNAVPTGGNLATTAAINGSNILTGATTGDLTTILSGVTGGAITDLVFNDFPVGSTLTNDVTISLGGLTFFAPAGTSSTIFSRATSPDGDPTMAVFLTGTFAAAGFDSTPGTANISFTQNGAAISGSGTLFAAPVPPPPMNGVPVPATALLAGVGGLFMAGARRLRRAA